MYICGCVCVENVMCIKNVMHNSRYAPGVMQSGRLTCFISLLSLFHARLHNLKGMDCTCLSPHLQLTLLLTQTDSAEYCARYQEIDKGIKLLFRAFVIQEQKRKGMARPLHGHSAFLIHIFFQVLFSLFLLIPFTPFLVY